MGTLFRDKITANLVTFNDRTAAPAGSVEWWMDVAEGWDDTAEVDLVSTRIGGGADGEIVGEVAPARARHMLLSGYAVAASRPEAAALADIVIRDAFPRSADITLTRYEGITKTMVVRVSEKRQIVHVGPDNFRWIVPVLAGDPLKYGVLEIGGSSGVAGQSSGGRTYDRTYPLTYINTASESDDKVVVDNAGTAPTQAIATIAGPLIRGSWRISNDTYGDDLRFDVGLSIGDSLVIDFKEGTALLNGYPVTATIFGDFWKIRPGVNVIRLYGDYDPSAGMTISAKSAWE